MAEGCCARPTARSSGDPEPVGCGASGHLDVLVECCPTKILLPNEDADKAGTAQTPARATSTR